MRRTYKTFIINNEPHNRKMLYMDLYYDSWHLDILQYNLLVEAIENHICNFPDITLSQFEKYVRGMLLKYFPLPGDITSVFLSCDINGTYYETLVVLQ